MKKRIFTILVICILAAATVFAATAAGRIGDLNGDGSITIFDAQLLLESQLGLRQLTDAQQANLGNLSFSDLTQLVLKSQKDPLSDPRVIATVENDGILTYVTSVADMVAGVNADGNTVITLNKDITTTSQINLPYTCTIDLNGHTINTGTTSGNGLNINAVGSEKQVTTVKNGKLVHFEVGIRALAGAVVVENMTIDSKNGSCVGIYDNNAAYKSINRITGSTLSSKNFTCVVFNQAGTSYKDTGITVDNSTLISYKASGAFIFAKRSDAARTGTVNFGENVNLYTYQSAPATNDYSQFSGNLVNKDPNPATVTVDGVKYEGLNRWSTDIPFTGTKILAIGNSFCFRLVEELYGVAHAAGEEVLIANLYHAGCTVNAHWTWLNDGSPNYDLWFTTSMGRWVNVNIKTIEGAINYYDDWDIITLQQHFAPERTTDYNTALKSCDPYVKNLYDHLKTVQPNAKLYWHQTWAYSTAHSSIGTEAVQTNQYNQIKAVSDYLAEQNGVPQIPCGDAWVLARANPVVTADPCLDDNYHDGDETGGQYLNACVWFETLFGKSCVGNTWRPTQNWYPNSYTLSESLISALQNAAHEAVAEMHGDNYAK